MSSLLSSLALSSTLLSSSVLGSPAPVTPDLPPETEISGRSWVGTADNPRTHGYPRLNLSDGGGAGGYDGCNSFGYRDFDDSSGRSWTQVDNQIFFHGMKIGTERFCGEENWFLAANTFIIDGENLLLYRDGELMGTMVPYPPR